MQDVMPFTMPAIGAEEADLENRFFKASGRVFLDVKGTRFRVSFLPAFDLTYQPAIAASLYVNGRPGHVDMDRLPLPKLLGFPNEGISPLEIPDDLLPVLVEGMLSPILERAELALGGKVRVDRVWTVDETEISENHGYSLNLEFREEGGRSRVRVRLFLQKEDLAFLIQEVESQMPAPKGGWEGIPVALRFRTGALALSLEELGDLEPGDVLLMDMGRIEADRLEVCAGESDKVIWTATIQEESAVLENESNEEYQETPSQADLPDGLQSVEINLAFDVGSRMATLAEIAGFAAGSIIELPGNPNGLVNVRISGKRIAVGTMVMVDGRAGVRIESFTNGNGHDN